MEESGEESLDGSSIKPVSSLRSHFEQMANAKPNNTFGTKALSPQPTGGSVSNGTRDVFRSTPEKQEDVPFGDVLRAARGREKDAGDASLRPPRTTSANMSPSPTRALRPRPVSTVLPAVTILPPQSPPKNKNMNLTLSSTPSYLSTETPLSTTSGGSSPRHFRIPSRPQTPLLEPGKSPRLPTSQPPSPPPPRRSGELRREQPAGKGPPPPVNRAEKPKIASKPMSLAFRTEATTLEPGASQHYNDKTSPFSTPPSSGSSPSPERELPPPITQPRPWNPARKTSFVQKGFEPPPVHHSVIAKRKDQETNGLGRSIIIPQVTGEQPPALPTRPQLRQETSNPRNLENAMMPPPPPRPSMDRTRPAVTTSSDNTTFATPPKRVFSTPTTQLQTPPRTHGRSMTVDRHSERAPNEIRTPITPLVPHTDSRASFDVPPTTSIIKELHPNLGEYPDASRSNRRPPFFKQGAHEISTKYDTRILDVCGEFICTSGHLTRVWSLLDGEIVTSLAHTEGIKIVSVGFKPAADMNEEGTRVWLGNNIGELTEIDVRTQSIVTSKTNAHTRREIIKMYRHKMEMWTLDDGGTLHLWAPDSTGAPNLTNPTQSFRVPKGHTFSMVVRDELWHATGKDVRVFVPTVDGSTQFQVLQRPLFQPNTGDITSGTTLSSQPDKVYFGHTDGKISVYSRRDYSCLGVVNISVYKITTLAGVGGYLWAGFSTGMIYVYDTTKSPWLVKKDWTAHKDPVIKLLPDQSSCWSLERAQVISLGQDNMLRVWDGLLQEDWLETQMQAQEAEFCELNSIKTLVMTWNAGASTPYHLQHSDQDAKFFRDLIQGSGSPDILVFGFQELVDLENKKTVTKSFFKSKKKDPTEQEHMSHQYRDWRDFLIRSLDDYMPRDELYHLLHTAHLVGLFTCIFVKASLRERIKSLSAAEVKRGMGGALGNKGALVIRFILDDTSLCFINCHLAAGQTQTKDRNADITAILEGPILPAERDHSVRQDSYIGGGDGTMILDHEICVLNGDLNYRIDTMGRDTVVSAVKSKNLSKLLERDQLLASKRKNPWFKLRSFVEMPITFAPTYKYDVGTDNYDTSEKKRSPAWCDRVMYRGRDKDRVKQLDYQRHEVRVSDHRPVTGTFEMVIKTVSPKRRAMKWDECQKRMLERKERLANEASLNYLTNILGFDVATSQKLISQKQKGR
ncbi:putative PI phosphatase group protein-like protein [Acephala macrosclerotiorum]|nr:putative PI phosphatase group protein-like protein [Acephala macrosclerotiorum]